MLLEIFKISSGNVQDFLGCCSVAVATASAVDEHLRQARSFVRRSRSVCISLFSLLCGQNSSSMQLCPSYTTQSFQKTFWIPVLMLWFGTLSILDFVLIVSLSARSGGTICNSSKNEPDPKTSVNVATSCCKLTSRHMLPLVELRVFRTCVSCCLAFRRRIWTK